MIKTLITGGSGFIGSHLCERLLDRGHYVICLDNFYTSRIDNIKHLFDNKNFKFIEHDIVDKIDIEVDQIYNLACPASPVHYQNSPVKTILTSVLGIYNMLELTKKYNAKILQSSTSEVYGDPTVHPQVEEYWGNVNPIGKRSCYDEGKRCGEALLMDYRREYSTEIRIARIFNTYGPRMAVNDGRVISNFIVQALRNEPIYIYGDGSQTRSFCYVDDLINGLISLMDSKYTGPFNLGNPDERTILDFAKKIIKFTNSNSEIIFKELPENDPLKRCPDISKARKYLNFEPKISLDEGIMNTINYFKQII